jgi:glucose/arabinose dehydrogenase/azurin
MIFSAYLSAAPRRFLGWVFVLIALAATGVAQAQPKLVLKQDDHIALIGGTLPERFQHSGYLETYIVARNPKLNLVFRNLALSGDEVVTRHRSENFGTPDDWLTRVGADVIFAFFGFNESFHGPEGLEKFKGDLDKFLKETKEKNYSGKGAPRVVLFSSIANEKHQDPNFPDPRRNNANIEIYTAAMAEVAARTGTPFVDLFAPSLKLFSEAAAKKQSLTVDGLMLSPRGDELLAGVIFNALFNEPAPSGNFDKLRAAINEKSEQWHARYRTIDGYNVYGGRSQLSFDSGKSGPKITNYKVMQEEMTQRDVLTANRDKKVWAAANGQDYVVDDSNLPPVTPVKSNKPGPLPDETWPFLGGQEAISKMTVHSGMKVNLFASEEKFPMLTSPVQMAWDTKGRLWVAVWPNYPGRAPLSKDGDKLLVFEDTDGDGVADKQTVFLDDLNAPTGFQFYKDGVLVMQAPSLWFVRDTDGDGKADWKERILMGLDSADSHHTANAICHEPGGAIYLSDGVFHRTQVETADGVLRNNDASIYRFEPNTGKFENYVSYGFANPHGRVFDRWGNDIITDATGNNSYFAPAFSGRLDYPAKHSGLKDFWNRPSRPCPGTGILSSRHFPEEFQGNFLNINVISFQGVFRVKVTEDGSGLKGETMENLISSSDPNFRPIAITMGPEGAIYFLDWHNPIIGHMQHHLRDPNRDHGHGRIYRISYEGRPYLERPKIHGQPVEKLLDLLKEPEDMTRELAKVELSTHDPKTVAAAAKEWADKLDKSDKEYAHHLLEALWVHQWNNVVDVELLNRVLASEDGRARAQAARVLGYWRDRIPDALSRFEKIAADDHPRVRLEAVRNASFYREAKAAEVALAIVKKPMDYYLEYTLKETLRQLEPYWRKAIAGGQALASDNPAGLERLIGSLNNTELLKLPKTPGVLEAVLTRPGMTDADRSVALDGLATARGKEKIAQLLEVVKRPGVDSGVARLLTFQSSEDLKKARAQIVELINGATSPETRQAAWGALALADDSFDKVWAEAEKTPSKLADLMYGVSYIPDAAFRAKAYDRVKPILTKSSATEAAAGPPKARFARIELPRTGTLTLAEVEVFSGGQNVARFGKAKQSSVSNGGVAGRAIDGKMDGDYGSGTQTHSAEDTENPWWEVDLGDEKPLESVAVWNRTDGELGKRLNGFTLTLLDAGRHPVFTKANNPAPARNATIAISDDSGSSLRRAAIRAVVSMNTQQGEVFDALANIIAAKQDVTAASQGLRALPRANWPKQGDGAAKIAEGLVAWAEGIPTSARTTPDYVETVQFASDVAGYLPAAKAAPLRAKLKGLRVPVFIIRSVREQMRFDTPRIVVEAGKPVEITFENVDFMPHNLAVVRPNTREMIGEKAALMKPDQLDGRGRAYIPDDVAVISATKLLDANQRQTLSLTAPNDEGECEYVCTFPGHHLLMWGKMIVTKDVDAYLAAHPEAPAVGTGAATGHQHNHE